MDNVFAVLGVTNMDDFPVVKVISKGERISTICAKHYLGGELSGMLNRLCFMQFQSPDLITGSTRERILFGSGVELAIFNLLLHRDFFFSYAPSCKMVVMCWR